MLRICPNACDHSNTYPLDHFLSFIKPLSKGKRNYGYPRFLFDTSTHVCGSHFTVERLCRLCKRAQLTLLGRNVREPSHNICDSVFWKVMILRSDDQTLSTEYCSSQRFGRDTSCAFWPISTGAAGPFSSASSCQLPTLPHSPSAKQNGLVFQHCQNKSPINQTYPSSGSVGSHPRPSAWCQGKPWWLQRLQCKYNIL